MSEHSKGLVPIQQVVYDFLNELGEYTDDNFFRWLNVVARGFANLNMKRLESFQVAYLDVNPDSFSARLPLDFIDYLKIGVVDGNTIRVIGINKNILVNEDANGETVNDGGLLFMPHLFNGQMVTGLYGLPGGYSSPTFNIDKIAGLIRLSSHVPTTKIILEYTSSGLSLTGSTFVPYKASEALIEFLHWRKKKSDAKATRGEVLDAKQDYLEAVEEMSFYDNLPTREDIILAFYSGSGQGAKR